MDQKAYKHMRMPSHIIINFEKCLINYCFIIECELRCCLLALRVSHSFIMTILLLLLMLCLFANGCCFCYLLNNNNNKKGNQIVNDKKSI